MNRFRLKQILTLSPYLLMVLTFCLNFRWILSDHDDGHTLGYHAMGRNEAIQRCYGAYDSMCDYLLGLLPVNYYVLLGAMVFTTFLSALSLIFIIRKIVTNYFSIEPVSADLGILIFLIGMPEFLYLLLSFKSVIISLNLILLGFYLVLSYQTNKKTLYYIGSIVLFGFGVSLRWNNLFYGLPIAAVIFYLSRVNSSLKNALIQTLKWGIPASLSSLIFIYISGYKPEDIVETYLWGKNYAEKIDFALMARMADLSMFLTPLSFLTLLIGCFALIKYRKNNRLAILWIVTSILPTFTIGFAPSFKYLANWWPFFIFMLAFSVQFIIRQHNTIKYAYLATSFFCIFINWFIGVQINTNTSNYGPGFDIKKNIGNNSIFYKTQRVDDRLKFENIKIGLFDGFCIPGSEGIRPLYGHAYALFGGKLLALDKKLNRETDEIVGLAAKTKSVIYQDRINPYLLASYLRFGYITSDHWKQEGKFSKRNFNNENDNFTELRVNSPQDLFDIELLKQNTNPSDTLYLSFTYSSALNKFLYIWENEYHYPYEKLGPFSAKIYRNDNRQ